MTTPGKIEVLVVGDEARVRQLLCASLAARGFRVRLAASGEEAVRVYSENRGSIALVLCDVLMAPGMDGIKTLEARRQVDEAVRVVFMTGYAGAEARPNSSGRASPRSSASRSRACVR